MGGRDVGADLLNSTVPNGHRHNTSGASHERPAVVCERGFEEFRHQGHEHLNAGFVDSGLESSSYGIDKFGNNFMNLDFTNPFDSPVKVFDGGCPVGLQT